MKKLLTETTKLTFDGRMLISELLKDIEMDVIHVKADHKASVEITGAYRGKRCFKYYLVEF